MAIAGGFTMVLVAPTPLFLQWPVAFFFMFLGQSLSVSMEGAPGASYSWHAMEIRKRRSRCAENGLIDRSPTTLVCTVQTYSHRRGRKRFMGRGSGGCMGREGGREFGLVSYGRVSYGREKKILNVVVIEKTD
jgi:hypothetical protein